MKRGLHFHPLFTHSLHIFEPSLGRLIQDMTFDSQSSFRWGRWSREQSVIEQYGKSMSEAQHRSWSNQEGPTHPSPLASPLLVTSPFVHSEPPGADVGLDTAPQCKRMACRMGGWPAYICHTPTQLPHGPMVSKQRSTHLKWKALCGISPMTVAREKEENHEQLKSKDRLTLQSAT